MFKNVFAVFWTLVLLMRCMSVCCSHVLQPYLHESRHLHAMRRARGSGGRFLNTKKLDSINTNIEPDKGAISPGGPVSTHPFNSLHSELSNFSGSVHSSSGHMEVTGIHVQEMRQPQTYSNANGNGWYRRR